MKDRGIIGEDGVKIALAVMQESSTVTYGVAMLPVWVYIGGSLLTRPGVSQSSYKPDDAYIHAVVCIPLCCT